MRPSAIPRMDGDLEPAVPSIDGTPVRSSSSNNPRTMGENVSSLPLSTSLDPDVRVAESFTKPTDLTLTTPPQSGRQLDVKQKGIGLKSSGPRKKIPHLRSRAEVSTGSEDAEGGENGPRKQGHSVYIVQPQGGIPSSSRNSIKHSQGQGQLKI